MAVLVTLSLPANREPSVPTPLLLFVAFHFLHLSHFNMDDRLSKHFYFMQAGTFKATLSISLSCVENWYFISLPIDW